MQAEFRLFPRKSASLANELGANTLDNEIPGRPKARRERGKARLQLLMAATDELVSARELHEISLQHIAERARVPISSVYHFFPNREAAFFQLARKYLQDFERLSEAALNRQPDSWQSYISERVMASAEYCNAKPGVMRLLLGPYFSELRRDNVAGIFSVANARVRALHHFFRMPEVDDLADKVATAIALVDGIQSLSYAMHGKITTHYAEESARAAVLYLRSFLPDVIPVQETDNGC